MSRDHRLYLDDILKAIGNIQKYMEGMDYESFSCDGRTQDAVVRNLEIIGEASGHLSESVRNASPEIEWRKLIGLRNILIHEYFGISVPIVWDILQNKLDLLEATCRSLAKTNPGEIDESK